MVTYQTIKKIKGFVKNNPHTSIYKLAKILNVHTLCVDYLRLSGTIKNKSEKFNNYHLVWTSNKKLTAVADLSNEYIRNEYDLKKAVREGKIAPRRASYRRVDSEPKPSITTETKTFFENTGFELRINDEVTVKFSKDVATIKKNGKSVAFKDAKMFDSVLNLIR
jgi:hypothetical protein